MRFAALVTLGSLQSFAALYAKVRIWSVVFYKKLVIIPRLTTREGQSDGGYIGVITLALLVTSPHPQLPSSAHQISPQSKAHMSAYWLSVRSDVLRGRR